jgi:pimeloyl-ACP methyl ester carboxylesterase
MATMVIKDEPDEQTMMAAYQSLTVLARLVWERPYDPKLSARLRRISCPTLLVWGDHDRLVPPAYGEAYKKYIPHAEMRLIKDCGHMPMFEREAEFVQLITEFCQRPV